MPEPSTLHRMRVWKLEWKSTEPRRPRRCVTRGLHARRPPCIRHGSLVGEGRVKMRVTTLISRSKNLRTPISSLEQVANSGCGRLAVPTTNKRPHCALAAPNDTELHRRALLGWGCAGGALDALHAELSAKSALAPSFIYIIGWQCTGDSDKSQMLARTSYYFPGK